MSALSPPEPLLSVVDVVPELLELDEDPLDDPADTLVIPVVVTADESEVGAWQAPRTRSATCGRDLTAATLPLPDVAGYPGLRLAGR